MQEFNVEVATADGHMDCFMTHPQGPGPYAAVILYMDVPGIREELRDFARRIAGEGYFCVLPDLYYREGKVRFDLTKGESELKKMFAVGGALTNAMVMRDTQGILDYLAAQDGVRSHVGVVGYCMSGQFVLSAAGTFPDRIKATVALYGTRMVTEQNDSPHKLIPSVNGEVYFSFAEHDPYVESHVVHTLKSELDKYGKNYEIEQMAGTEHGFSFPMRPSYNAAAAELAWQKMFDVYARQL